MLDGHLITGLIQSLALCFAVVALGVTALVRWVF